MKVAEAQNCQIFKGGNQNILMTFVYIQFPLAGYNRGHIINYLVISIALSLRIKYRYSKNKSSCYGRHSHRNAERVNAVLCYRIRSNTQMLNSQLNSDSMINSVNKSK